MSNDADGPGSRTRRYSLRYGGGIVGGGLLAGCTASSGSDGSDPTGTSTEARTTTPTDALATTRTEASTATPEQSDTVEMAPVGTVEFESVPETWESYFPVYADMGVALGQADGLSAVEFESRFHTRYADELDDEWADRETWVEWFDDRHAEDAAVDPDSERFRRVRRESIAASRSSSVAPEEVEPRTARGHEALAAHLGTEAVVAAVGERALLEAIRAHADADRRPSEVNP